MTERDKRALDFLLSADFSPINGHSYGELLDYLRQFKYYYSIIYDDRREMKRTIELSIEEIARLNNKIEMLEKTIEKRDYQNRNLKEELGRKLTWKERLLGKLILKL